MQKRLYIYIYIYIYEKSIQPSSEAHVGYPGIRHRESLHHPASDLMYILSPSQ